MSLRSAIHTGPIRSAASSKRPTAGAPGAKCSTRTPTPARSRWRWSPGIRTSSTPRSGRRAVRRGTSIRPQTVPAAGSTKRPTPARRGRSSPTAFRTRRAYRPFDLAAAPHRVYANVDSPPKAGGVYRSDDAGATWTHTTATQRDLAARLVLQRHHRRSAQPRRRLRDEHGDLSLDERREELRRDPRRSDGRRLSHAMDRSRRLEPHDSRQRPGRRRQRQRREDVELVVQPADGAVLSRRYRQRVSVFGVRRAARFRARPSRPTASKYGTISQQDFRPIDVGGENGNLAPDPRHPDLVYGDSSGEGGPTVTREIPATGWEQNVDPMIAHPQTTWRNTWTLPLAFSPADRTSLYFGHQNVFRSRDGGETWKIVSPDLSRADEGTPSNLDAPTLADDNNVRRHGVVYAIAPSPLRAGLVWAGTDDGYVWVTRDRRLGAGSPGRTSRRRQLTRVEQGRHHRSVALRSGRAYAAVDRHRLDDYKPYIYRTRDGGATWTRSPSGIPDGLVRQRRTRRSGPGAACSMPAPSAASTSRSTTARTGSRLQLNLPVTSIRDIAVHGNDLVIATHGRAFWVMDDLAPLRQIGRRSRAAEAISSRRRPPIACVPATKRERRCRSTSRKSITRRSGCTSTTIFRTAPHTPVVIEMLAGDGSVVRRWSSAQPPKPVDPNSVHYTTHWIERHPVPQTGAGAHRFVWDFHEETSDGPLVPPGAYTVRLSVDGTSTRATPRVLRDPRIAASDADLTAQYELARRVHALRAEVDERAREGRSSSRSELSPDATARSTAQVVGEQLPTIPDDSMGAYSHDFTSFLFLGERARLSRRRRRKRRRRADSDMRTAYDKLAAIYHQTLAQVSSDLEVTRALTTGRPEASARTSARGRCGIARARACADRPCGPTRRIHS